MKVTPMRDCIIVKPDDMIKETEGGIILSDATYRRPTTGTIMNVGPDVIDELKEGTRVFFGEYSGNKYTFEWNGEDIECLLMTSEDIFATLER